MKGQRAQPRHALPEPAGGSGSGSGVQKPVMKRRSIRKSKGTFAVIPSRGKAAVAGKSTSPEDDHESARPTSHASPVQRSSTRSISPNAGPSRKQSQAEIESFFGEPLETPLTGNLTTPGFSPIDEPFELWSARRFSTSNAPTNLPEPESTSSNLVEAADADDDFDEMLRKVHEGIDKNAQRFYIADQIEDAVSRYYDGQRDFELLRILTQATAYAQELGLRTTVIQAQLWKAVICDAMSSGTARNLEANIPAMIADLLSIVPDEPVEEAEYYQLRKLLPVYGEAIWRELATRSFLLQHPQDKEGLDEYLFSEHKVHACSSWVRKKCRELEEQYHNARWPDPDASRLVSTLSLTKKADHQSSTAAASSATDQSDEWRKISEKVSELEDENEQLRATNLRYRYEREIFDPEGHLVSAAMSHGFDDDDRYDLENNDHLGQPAEDLDAAQQERKNTWKWQSPGLFRIDDSVNGPNAPNDGEWQSPGLFRNDARKDHFEVLDGSGIYRRFEENTFGDWMAQHAETFSGSNRVAWGTPRFSGVPKSRRPSSPGVRSLSSNSGFGRLSSVADPSEPGVMRVVNPDSMQEYLSRSSGIEQLSPRARPYPPKSIPVDSADNEIQEVDDGLTRISPRALSSDSLLSLQPQDLPLTDTPSVEKLDEVAPHFRELQERRRSSVEVPLVSTSPTFASYDEERGKARADSFVIEGTGMRQDVEDNNLLQDDMRSDPIGTLNNNVSISSNNERIDVAAGMSDQRNQLETEPGEKRDSFFGNSRWSRIVSDKQAGKKRTRRSVAPLTPQTKSRPSSAISTLQPEQYTSDQGKERQNSKDVLTSTNRSDNRSDLETSALSRTKPETTEDESTQELSWGESTHTPNIASDHAIDFESIMLRDSTRMSNFLFKLQTEQAIHSQATHDRRSSKPAISSPLRNTFEVVEDGIEESISPGTKEDSLPLLASGRASNGMGGERPQVGSDVTRQIAGIEDDRAPIQQNPVESEVKPHGEPTSHTSPDEYKSFASRWALMNRLAWTQGKSREDILQRRSLYELIEDQYPSPTSPGTPRTQAYRALYGSQPMSVHEEDEIVDIGGAEETKTDTELLADPVAECEVDLEHASSESSSVPDDEPDPAAQGESSNSSSSVPSVAKNVRRFNGTGDGRYVVAQGSGSSRFLFKPVPGMVPPARPDIATNF